MKHLLPFFLFLAVGAVFLFGLYNSQKTEPSNKIVLTRLAPKLNISAPEGENSPEQKKLNDKYILVNFFASWCTPCLAELPFLKTLTNDNLIIYGIAWNDTKENINNWLKNNGNPYEYIDIDNAGKTGISFGITGVPESFLINPQGMIILHIKGVLTQEIIDKDIMPLIKQSSN